MKARKLGLSGTPTGLGGDSKYFNKGYHWVQYSKSVYKQIRRSASKEDLRKKATDKWSPKWKPYGLLSESEKDKDRIWASKVLEIIRSNEQSMRAFLSYKTSSA